MKTAEAHMSPMSLFTESVAAWSDFGRSAGEAWIETMLSLKPDMSRSGPEDFTRDLFRRLSDLNLQHWENTAKVIESMPEWMRWPQTVPGGMMTDWFDQMRRNGPAASFAALLDLANGLDSSPMDTMRRPSAIDAPEGPADDLTLIKGIGPKLSQTLNELGIYHFHQISAWEEPEAMWIDDFLAFKGRVTREQWIEQAQKLASASMLH